MMLRVFSYYQIRILHIYDQKQLNNYIDKKFTLKNF